MRAGISRESRMKLNLRSILLISIFTMVARAWAQSETPVPSAFFAMSGSGGAYPQVTIGALGHSDFAWGRIEQSKGVFNFQSFDKYMADALQARLVDPVTNTANMAMTLAAGPPSWAVPTRVLAALRRRYVRPRPTTSRIGELSQRAEPRAPPSRSGRFRFWWRPRRCRTSPGVSNAEGGIATIAPNTWVAIYGSNLAPAETCAHGRARIS